MRLVTAMELSSMLGGVSHFTLHRWAREGRIPFVAVGRLRRFDPEQVLRHLKDRTRSELRARCVGNTEQSGGGVHAGR